MDTATWEDEGLDVPDYPPDDDYYWADLENGCE